MTQTMLTTRHLAILLTLGLAAGCNSSDFTPVTQLDKPRVLAIRAEPVNPALDQTTVLEPLVYAPDGTTSTFAWSWCPLLGASADGFRCPVTDAQMQALATELGLAEPPPPLVLGSAATQDYKNVFPAEVLASICENGVAGAKPDCDGGFPVRVKLVVTNGGETVTATTLVRLPIDATTPSNANPAITGIQALVGGQMVTIDDSAQVELPRLVETEVHALVDASASESYASTTADHQPITLRERLVVSWFTEAGELADAKTAFIDGKTELADALKNQWKPLTVDDDPGEQSRVILVLRDNRGGVSWTRGLVRLGVQP